MRYTTFRKIKVTLSRLIPVIIIGPNAPEEHVEEKLGGIGQELTTAGRKALDEVSAWLLQG